MGAGIGFGMGMAAGVALIPALPSIFKGIGQGFAWLGTKVIAPAATFAWNNILKPVGIAIGKAGAWVGKGIAKGATAVAKGIAKVATTVANGVASVWNSIFHKKSKSA